MHYSENPFIWFKCGIFFVFFLLSLPPRTVNQTKSGRVACAEVSVGGGSRRSRVRPGRSLARRSHQRHICMCKKAPCWSGAASPATFSVCGRPACDLFKCSWNRPQCLSLCADASPAYYLLRPGRRLLFPGGFSCGSQLSVTVSDPSVCFSISILGFHRDGAEFRGRWLILKVIQSISGEPVNKCWPERLNLVF